MIRSWFLIAAVAAAGCGGYDAPPEIVTGTLTYTQPAPGADFAPLRTYYLDPKIEVWQDGESQLPQPVPASTVTVIQTQMAKYGYTQVTVDPAPGVAPAADVGIRLAYLKSTYAYYVDTGYCSVYWVYWSCWPSWAYAGSYTSGTVLTTMLDTKATAPKTSVLWVASLYGVLSGSSLDNQANLNTSFNRAFDQSPYLKTSAAP